MRRVLTWGGALLCFLIAALFIASLPWAFILRGTDNTFS
jgi:hypothetical protein